MTTPSIFPFLRYADAAAAIDWLVEAFGFQRHLVVPGPDDSIAHAQLSFGSSMILLGSSQDDALGLSSPSPGGSQGIYVHVKGVDAHYEHARQAGAEIVLELQDMDYGSREYAARDPEGYLWSFGTYLPGSEDHS